MPQPSINREFDLVQGNQPGNVKFGKFCQGEKSKKLKKKKH